MTRSRSLTAAPLADRSTYVYRGFGTRGQLLYVGISYDWRSRLNDHQKRSYWWQFAARIDVQEFPDRATAFAMESWSIAHETPLANLEPQRAHCPPEPPTPTRRFEQTVKHWSRSGHPIPVKEVDLADSEYQTGVLAF